MTIKNNEYHEERKTVFGFITKFLDIYFLKVLNLLEVIFFYDKSSKLYDRMIYITSKEKSRTQKRLT